MLPFLKSQRCEAREALQGCAVIHASFPAEAETKQPRENKTAALTMMPTVSRGRLSGKMTLSFRRVAESPMSSTDQD